MSEQTQPDETPVEVTLDAPYPVDEYVVQDQIDGAEK